MYHNIYNQFPLKIFLKLCIKDTLYFNIFSVNSMEYAWSWEHPQVVFVKDTFQTTFFLTYLSSAVKITELCQGPERLPLVWWLPKNTFCGIWGTVELSKINTYSNAFPGGCFSSKSERENNWVILLRLLYNQYHSRCIGKKLIH